MPVETRRALSRTLLFGALSGALYLLLYLFADRILVLSQQGRWMFVVPIAIAFAFSLVHGTFTGLFWDLLGFKAKAVKK